MIKIFHFSLVIYLIEANSNVKHCKKYFEHDTFSTNHTWVEERDAKERRTRWPWLVSVGGYCAGSLIGPRWVITAAHCCANPINHEIYVGSYTAIGHKNETFTVVDFRRHEKSNIATVHNDVCLLKLDKPVSLSSRAFPICLASRRSKIARPGSSGAVAGWSDQTEFGIPSPKILEKSLPIQNSTICKNQFHYYDASKMFCAGPVPVGGAGRHLQCVGDSGAPFVMMEDDQPVLVGVTSWGYGCQQGRPLGIHTSISNLVSWLVNKAIDMGAFMDSARQRNKRKLEEAAVVLKNAGTKMKAATKSVKKEQKQRRKRIKQRQKGKERTRRQNLERKFRFKMARTGEAVDSKKLKKFLKSQAKRKQKKGKLFLRNNQLKKLRTISSDIPVLVYNACTVSGFVERYGKENIERLKCSYRNEYFECTFKCLGDNLQPNAVLRCRGNKWQEVFIKEQHSICSRIATLKLRRVEVDKLSKKSIRAKDSNGGYFGHHHEKRPNEQGQKHQQAETDDGAKLVHQTCFNGTVEEGRDQFNQFYAGQLRAAHCRLKSNGGFECSQIQCAAKSKKPSSSVVRCVNGRWTPKKIKCH